MFTTEPVTRSHRAQYINFIINNNFIASLATESSCAKGKKVDIPNRIKGGWLYTETRFPNFMKYSHLFITRSPCAIAILLYCWSWENNNCETGIHYHRSTVVQVQFYCRDPRCTIELNQSHWCPSTSTC